MDRSQLNIRELESAWEKDVLTSFKGNAPIDEITRRISLKVFQGMEIAPLQCDGCRACCTAMGIEELDKPVDTPCRYECDQGCSIYHAKPPSCTAFSCLWRIHVVGDDETRFRPDRCGVVANYMPGTVFGPAIVSFHESYPGGANQPDAIELIERTSKRMPCILLPVGRSENEISVAAEPDDMRVIMSHATAKMTSQGLKISKIEIQEVEK